MPKVKHQYRVVVTIQDDFHPEKDLGYDHAYPSFPKFELALRFYERVTRIISKM